MQQLNLFVFLFVTVGGRAAKLSIGAALSGPVSDLGWSWRHNQGIIYMQQKLLEAYPGLEVHVSVEASAGHCDPKFEEWGQEGYDLVIGTSFEFHDCMNEKAKIYPDTIWFHVSGFLDGGANWGLGFSRLYQPVYLAGMVAGSLTQTNDIGMISPHPIPEVYRQLSAFGLGVKAVNPEAKIHNVWTNEWFKPDLERWLATQFKKSTATNVDVLGIHADSVAGYYQANELDMFAIGWNADHRGVVGERVLVSSYFFWGPIYFKAANLTYRRLFTSEKQNWWPHMYDDELPHTARLTDFSFFVPSSVRKRVQVAEEEIFHAGLDIFCNEISIRDSITNEITTIGKQGECLQDRTLLTMEWLVDNIIDYGTVNLPSEACDPGEETTFQFKNGKAQFSCQPCLEGTKSHQNSELDIECVKCTAGTYSEHHASNCTVCPIGKANNVPGAPKCLPCPEGSISPAKGMRECLPCEDGLTSNPTRDACVAKGGVSYLAFVIPLVCGAVLVIVLSVVGGFLFTLIKQRREKHAILSCAPTGNITIGFTDVESSTELWEQYQESMKESIVALYDLHREFLRKFQGYEVKTQGDSMMVAFSSPSLALEWCFKVQSELLKITWPGPLAREKITRVQFDTNNTTMLWNGPRVRMGFHFGCPNVVYDKIHKRVDYYGPMVNYAARVAGLASGGQILVSEDFYATLPPHFGPGIDHGVFPLKGIAGYHRIYQFATPGLEHRTFPPINTATAEAILLATKPAAVCPNCSRPCRHCVKDQEPITGNFTVVPIEPLSRSSSITSGTASELQQKISGRPIEKDFKGVMTESPSPIYNPLFNSNRERAGKEFTRINLAATAELT